MQYNNSQNMMLFIELERMKVLEIVKISVRNLVEFIFRSGDIVSGGMGVKDVEAMQAGSRLHWKIQKRMGPEYEAEVPLFSDHILKSGEDSFTLRVEGRADGVIHEDTTVIDEIKGVYFDIFSLSEPVYVHKAQAMCYAYMVAAEEELDEIGIQITYSHLESERERRFHEFFTWAEIETWFLDLLEKYSKWAMYEYQWKKQRNESIKNLSFPFEYREGQRKLVGSVYRTIEQGKKLYIEAPTGVGKTISTVFPAVKAMGEEICNRIFYLTAKTITRTVAEECFSLLSKENLRFKPITLTAKEKLCIFDKVNCNPTECERAKGHYDRVNEAVYDLLVHETKIDRDLILAYAQKHMVCPFEMSLDAALFADAVICDYNYVFDPNIYLKRFFSEGKKGDMVFLIDEAHNLVERGREMYSALLYKEDFLTMKRMVREIADKENDVVRKKELLKFIKALESGNKQMLEWKRQCDEFREIGEGETAAVGLFEFQLLRILGGFEEFLREQPLLSEREKMLDFYFNLRHFSNMLELRDEKYVIYSDYDEDGRFRVKLQCMDPSTQLSRVLGRGKSTIFFSATLLPIRYYKEQLAGSEEDYAVYAPSSFPPENRKIMIAKDVSTKYTRRTDTEYEKVADYLISFTGSKVGNYLVFFPSYAYMDKIREIFEKKSEVSVIYQDRSMTEQQKEDFLNSFEQETEETRVGFCVMGGIFSEGIDLKDDRLIGAAIVGTGLPMVCNERELFLRYYEKRKHHGFDYAYLYPGMNKVLQSGGRVIRTATDRGVVLLLDERFLGRQYRELFPREWIPYDVVNLIEMKEKLNEFWRQD